MAKWIGFASKRTWWMFGGYSAMLMYKMCGGIGNIQADITEIKKVTTLVM